MAEPATESMADKTHDPEVPEHDATPLNGTTQDDEEDKRPDLAHLTDTMFLRAEAITESEMKAVAFAQYVGEGFALVVLTVEVVLKFAMSDRTYLLSKAAQWWNVATSLGCLFALSACLSVFLTRIVRYRHKFWGRKRKVIVYTALAEALVLIISLLITSGQNLYILVVDCTWFSRFVRACTFIQWTCWNTLFLIMHVHARHSTFWRRKGKIVRRHGKDRTMMDAPFHVHWLAFEGVAAALLAVGSTGYDSRFRRVAQRCENFTYDCKQQASSVALLVTVFVLWLMWIAFWLVCVWRALRDLHERPWHRYKMPNIVIRVQVRSRTAYVLVFALSIILLGFVKINSCASYSQTWLGLTPVCYVFTTMTASALFFYMPKSPQLIRPMVQRMLQQFAWSDDQKGPRLDQRNRRLRDLRQDAMCSQPLFCFETAVKAFYFSALTYQYQEETAVAVGKRQPNKASLQGYTIEKAMELYNLERFELLVEPAEDTKVLVCWNTDTVVLSFRGTASMTNVLADLQVWMSLHPPRRGRFWRRPKVHAGFLKAWVANNLHRRVLSRIRAIFETPGVDVDKMLILVTGHSLGGALATLAAYDIAREFGEVLAPDQVVCYTFGAPRTGNHAFAKDYLGVVPDTWHLINTRDIVPRSGKFIHSYKRPGQRVVINQMGDMLVRPSFVEISASQNSLPLQSSVTDHYLASYQASIVSICSAQFGQKAFGDGVEGMRSLIAHAKVHDVLYEGLDEKRLERMAAWGGLTLFQITGQLQKGVNMLGAGAMETLGAKTANKPEEKSNTTLRCHNGVCWREDAGKVADEGDPGADADDDPLGGIGEIHRLGAGSSGSGPTGGDARLRRAKLQTLSKRRLGAPGLRAAAAAPDSPAAGSQKPADGIPEESREAESASSSSSDDDGFARMDSGLDLGMAASGRSRRGRLSGSSRRQAVANGLGHVNGLASPQAERDDDGGAAGSGERHPGAAGPADGIVSVDGGGRTAEGGVARGDPDAPDPQRRRHSETWSWRLRHMRFSNLTRPRSKRKGAGTAASQGLASDADRLYHGGSEDPEKSLHQNRQAGDGVADAAVQEASLHDLAMTHATGALKSSRNDRGEEEAAATSFGADGEPGAGDGTGEQEGASASQRSMASSAASSWKSGTLEDKLQAMEEKGMLPEVLQQAKEAKEARERCRQDHFRGFLHRTSHRPHRK